MTGKLTGVHRPAGERPDRPASVWLTGQVDLATQLTEGGYHPTTGDDGARIPPAIAAYAITAYSPPGGIVLDPDCGAGTTLVEALRAGRHAIGLTATPRWWRLARQNVTALKATGTAFDGMVLVLDRRPGLAAAQAAHLTGRIDLILTTLRLPKPESRAVDPANRALARLRQLLTACSPLLHPTGHLVITTRPYRRRGCLADLSGRLLAVARAAGFVPVEQCIALTGALHGERVITHASLSQRRAAARHQRLTGHPIAIPAHQDVLVFQPDRAADAARAAAAQSPSRPAARRSHRDTAAGQPGRQSA